MCVHERERYVGKSKDMGLDLFAPESGGSYEVFNARSLSDDIMRYCIEDVRLMPRLWREYNSKMSERWQAKVQQATNARVTLSQTTTCDGQGRHMAMSPKGWACSQSGVTCVSLSVQ